MEIDHPSANISEEEFVDVKLSLASNLKFDLFSSFLGKKQDLFTREEWLLWQLCSALWDYDDNLSESKLTSSQIEAVKNALKKERVSSWLKEAVSEDMETVIKKIKDSPSLDKDSKASRTIFTLLTGRQISRAVMEATKAKNFKLATILCQFGGAGSRVGSVVHGVPGRLGSDEDCRNDIIEQIQIWNKAITHPGSKGVFDEYLLACWSLFGGDATNWKNQVLNKVDDWKRCFGLFFWFCEGVNILSHFLNTIIYFPGLLGFKPSH